MSAGMIVVGAGECGARAAFALRDFGWTGSVTLVGDERTDPYERPPLSKEAMTAPDTLPPKTICDSEDMRAADIEFVAGVAATDIDLDAHELALADGRRIRYWRLLLATGATARRLPLGGDAIDAIDGVHYLRRYSDAVTLRDRFRPGTRISVIGGGFIGLELAASASIRGCAVTVIEVAPRVMSRVVPQEVATVVAERHHQAGVELMCATSVTELACSNGVVTLQLTNGDAVECDTVVAGVGAVPETTLAEKADIVVDNGIRVDEYLKASAPDVFAAGDCCSFPHPRYGNRRIRLESWRNAQDQGTAAARNMLGAGKPYTTIPWFWSDQYDLTLQIAGLPDTATTEVVRRRPDGIDIRFGIGPDGQLLAASAVGHGNAVAKDIRLAEILIARSATPDLARLADSTVNLKALLNR